MCQLQYTNTITMNSKANYDDWLMRVITTHTRICVHIRPACQRRSHTHIFLGDPGDGSRRFRPRETRKRNHQRAARSSSALPARTAYVCLLSQTSDSVGGGLKCPHGVSGKSLFCVRSRRGGGQEWGSRCVTDDCLTRVFNLTTAMFSVIVHGGIMHLAAAPKREGGFTSPSSRWWWWLWR
jgi:hypothetical protein